MILYLNTFVLVYAIVIAIYHTRDVTYLLSSDPILNYLRNTGDPDWTRGQAQPWTPFHFYRLNLDKDLNQSCRIDPQPFEQVYWRSDDGLRYYGMYSCKNWRPSFLRLPSRVVASVLKARTAQMLGTYEVHAGYYRSPIRTFNLTLVGAEHEVEVEYDRGWKGLWKIRRVGVSYKFQDIIFQYPDEGFLGSRLPQLEGQCWHFHVSDLTQEKAPTKAKLKGQDMDLASFGSGLLPYRLFGIYGPCTR